MDGSEHVVELKTVASEHAPDSASRGCCAYPVAEHGDGAIHLPVLECSSKGARASRPDPSAASAHRIGRRVAALSRGLGIWLMLVGGCASLFVTLDEVETRLAPNLTTGWRHLLLTLRAALVIAIGCAVVYFVMRRQQMRITETADELGRRLEAYSGDRRVRSRFENPHRVNCWEVLGCDDASCPAMGRTDLSCWEIVALSKENESRRPCGLTIQTCHECEVYLRSCPDGLARLGESFNSLMFLLDEEAAHVQRMQAQMVEKEKMVAIGQMASGLAHEIGNPLSSISSCVQMIRRKGSSPQAERKLDLIQGGIDRISRTVRQLGSVARPASDRWERVDLGPALEEAVTLVSFDKRAKQVSVEIESLPPLPETFAIREEIQQVFINLLINALDAMDGEGTLTISAERDKGRLFFRFDDTGCGISDEARARVFEPFFTTKDQGKGTGMGLAVCYGIVRKHGGEICFTDRPGGGTSFVVELPVLARTPEYAT